jgi:hypothetical protein
MLLAPSTDFCQSPYWQTGQAYKSAAYAAGSLDSLLSTRLLANRSGLQISCLSCWLPRQISVNALTGKQARLTNQLFKLLAPSTAFWQRPYWQKDQAYQKARLKDKLCKHVLHLQLRSLINPNPHG